MKSIKEEANVGGFFSENSEYLPWIGGAFALMFMCLCGGLISSGEVQFSGSNSEMRSVDEKVDESMKHEEWYSRYKRAYENENFDKAGRIFCRNNPGAC